VAPAQTQRPDHGAAARITQISSKLEPPIDWAGARPSASHATPVAWEARPTGQ